MSQRICKSCGKILTGRPFRCPNCRAFLQIRWLIGAAILILFLILIISLMIANESHKLDTAKIIEGMPALLKDAKPCSCQGYSLNDKEQGICNNLFVKEIYEKVVSADKIQSDYDSNEETADNSYKDKTLLVVGEVKSVNQENGYISLYGEKTISNEPHASIANDNSSYLRNIKKGQIIYLVCIGAGSSKGSALLNECTPVNLYINYYVHNFCDECSEGIPFAQNLFWYIRKAAQVLPSKSVCYETDIRKYKECITEIDRLVVDDALKVAEDKVISSFEKTHPSFKKVELIEVPNTDVAVKIIRRYDKINSASANGFMIAKFDINNDGLDDILYTHRGSVGSCGYSWNIVINKGKGKYRKNECSIPCTDKSLYFSDEYFQELKVPYFMEDKKTYDCLNSKKNK